MTKFIALIMLVYYLDEEWFNIIYINSAKHSKIKMINFQRVNESRRKNSQEPWLRTTNFGKQP